MPRRLKAKPSRSHEEATVEGLCANSAFAAESPPALDNGERLRSSASASVD
jgi:hypothetical protein